MHLITCARFRQLDVAPLLEPLKLQFLGPTTLLKADSTTNALKFKICKTFKNISFKRTIPVASSAYNDFYMCGMIYHNRILYEYL